MEAQRRIETIGLARAAVLTGVVIMIAASALSAATHVVDATHAKASDDNAGTAESPLKTLARALAVARGGDTILLGDGEYPAVSITARYPETMTIRAKEGAKPVFVDGLECRGAERLRVGGIRFAWRDDARPNRMKPFVGIDGCRHVEVADCTIADDPNKTEWVGMAARINASEQVTIRNCEIHCVYFGVAVTGSEHVVLQGLDIGPWTHEDGIRVTECLGPVLIDGCHLTNAGVAGRKGGHVDAIQVVFWSDNLTIRNCHIHGVAQAIGAFRCVDPRASIPNRRRKNWRIEGNLIYDVYTPHYATVCETDGVAVIHNTFPQGRANIFECTGATVRNNIFGVTGLTRDRVADADYNLWIASGSALGEHDLAGADPKFVNAETAFFKIEHSHLKDCTRTKLFPREVKGRLAVGDQVEIVLTDGSARDGRRYRIAAMGDNWIEIDPPLPADPGPMGVLIYKWPDGHKDLRPDYRLRPDSPAIDSADGDVPRGKDRYGHAAYDVAEVKNTGRGKVPYLDRGAFEHVPPE